MSVLDQIFQVNRSQSGTLVSSGGLFGMSFLNSGSGTLANTRSALGISAFFNGVDQITNDIAKLPKGVFLKYGNTRESLTDHPVNYLLNVEPNNLMTAYDFWKVIGVSVLLKGDGFAKIIRNQISGLEENYIFLNWEDVKVFKSGQKLYYNYKGENLPSEDMLHFKGFSFDGLKGVGVVTFAAKQLGVMLDAQNYSSDIYKDRGIGYGVIESDKDVNSDNKKAIEDGFAAKMSSKNKFKVPMLDSGMKYKNISITPAEAEFLETNKYGVLEVCRWLNINPHKIKDFSAGTYSNVYQQSIEHVQDSIVPWTTRIEQEVTRKTFVRDSNKYFRMNVNALLRGDLTSKKDYYTAMTYAGVYTRNEIRALEEMNPIDGLDEILQPVNMQALSVAMELIKQNKNESNK